MNILVLGAGGFIGSHISAGLSARGHRVVGGVRDVRSISRPDPDQGLAHGMQSGLACDLSVDHDPMVWAERLKGFEAVVNAVGILRPRGRQSFVSVHVEGPRALWAGCEMAGVGRVVQVSALGDPSLTEFIGSKHRGDRLLMDSGLDFTILRPSVVHAPTASYGGTALLRALAYLPGALLLPGKGEQQIQPVTLADLVDVVVRCLERRLAARRVVEVVGPRVITLRGYLEAYRSWLGRRSRRTVWVPLSVARAGAGLGERFGAGPMGSTMMLMLEQGNVGASGALEDTRELLGRSPRSVTEALSITPADDSDRWHAALYLLRPALRLAVALLWIGSGIVGLTAGPEASREIVAALGLSPSTGWMLIGAASILDLFLGAMLLFGIWIRPALTLMMVSLVAYTVALGWALPSLWLEPTGGLIKNLPLIPALIVLAVLESRR